MHIHCGFEEWEREGSEGGGSKNDKYWELQRDMCNRKK